MKQFSNVKEVKVYKVTPKPSLNSNPAELERIRHERNAASRKRFQELASRPMLPRRD